MKTRLGTLIIVWALGTTAFAQRNLGEPFVYENTAGRTMPYRLFTPPEASDDSDLPLVVFLHGAGERGNDNRAQVAVHINGLIEATQEGYFPAYLLAPQVPQNGNGWSADGVSDLGIEIIDSLSATLPIDTNRMYVTGLSMGGFGSYNYVTQYPDKFAAAVPMSGWYNPNAGEVIKDVPIWSFHGDRDSVVVPEGSRDMFDAITVAGGTTYLTEVVAGSHVIWSPIYGDARREVYGMYEWMFSQTNERRSPESLIEFHSEWAYLDDGSDQGDAWRNVGFDDASWQRGASPLGFGYEDQATVVACGPGPDCDEEKHATFYFRRDFTVEDPTQLENVMVQMVRDDGAIVYVNGEMVFRDSNIRSTTVFDTFARTNALDNGLSAFRIDDAIVQGVNTIAVELHQSSRGTTDLRFDLEMTAQVVPEPSACGVLAIGVIGLLMLRRSK